MADVMTCIPVGQNSETGLTFRHEPSAVCGTQVDQLVKLAGFTDLAPCLSIPCICVREVWGRENSFRALLGAVNMLSVYFLAPCISWLRVFLGFV